MLLHFRNTFEGGE